MPTKVVIQLTEVEESKVLPNLLRHYPWYLFAGENVRNRNR